MIQGFMEKVYLQKCRLRRGLAWVSTWGLLLKKNGSHVLWVYEEDGAVAGRSGRNKLRYLNHSTKSSAEFDGFELFACRKINVGEEITINYGEDWGDIN
jgi:hypothetical protein